MGCEAATKLAGCERSRAGKQGWAEKRKWRVEGEGEGFKFF
jgi:hypothetical protein